jgi:hypothetical protein
MPQSFFAVLIALACAAPIGASVAFYNFVESGRYGRALLTLSAMVAVLVLIAPR